MSDGHMGDDLAHMIMSHAATFARNNIRALDVTKKRDLLEAAKNCVACVYSQLSSPRKDPNLVYRDLFMDGFEEQHSHTIAALLPDPHEGKSPRIAGVIRLVLGKRRDDGLQPIDAMNLVKVSTWPHLALGVSDSQIAELSRFVVAEEFRSAEMREEKVPVIITSSMYREVCSCAAENGIEYIYAIMPRYVRDFIIQIGIETRELGHFELNMENPYARRMFTEYPVYWKSLQPMLYTFTNFKTYDPGLMLR